MSQIGIRVYGGGAIALGAVGLIWGDFASVWQPVPDGLPQRTALAYLAALLFLGSGLFMQNRCSAAYGLRLLVLLYALNVLLLHVPRVLTQPRSFAPWAGLAEQLALLAAGAVAMAASSARPQHGEKPALRVGRALFGVCLIVFGGAHFVYLADTAAMVPSWLIPGQRFWAMTTGLFHWLAAAAILAGVRAPQAARLLSLMFVVFGIFVHAPLIFQDAHSHLNWTANAMNLALIGAVWVIADSYGCTRLLHGGPDPETI